MKLILMKRGEGKTHKLIRECAEGGGYIICSSMVRAGQIQEQAMDMGLNILMPISALEFIDGRTMGRRITRFLIDDAEQVLQAMTPEPIAFMSLTIGEEDEEGI